MQHHNLHVFLHLWKTYSLHSLITKVLETTCMPASYNGAKEQNLHDNRGQWSGAAVLHSGARHRNLPGGMWMCSDIWGALRWCSPVL